MPSPKTRTRWASFVRVFLHNMPQTQFLLMQQSTILDPRRSNPTNYSVVYYIQQATCEFCSQPSTQPICHNTFLTAPSDAVTIPHKSAADSFSMETNASTGCILLPPSPSAALLPAPDRRRPRDPLLPPLLSPAPVEDPIEDTSLSQASSNGPSRFRHLVSLAYWAGGCLSYLCAD